MGYKTKEDQVAEFLREGIISGRFPRGAKLKQTEIANMLGISITPVREALKLLEAEGYVTGVSHHGVVVSPFEVDAVQEILELRILLEGRLTMAAMARITQRDLDDLLAMHREFEEAVSRGDRDAVRSINYRFHRRLYSIADQPQTLSFVSVLWARYPFDLINLIENRIERASSEHADILKALASGDQVGALAAVTAHIRSGWKEFREAREAHARGEAGSKAAASA